MRKRAPNFGERITNLRLQYGSQKALAESLGVSVRTVRRWEKRKEAPGGTTAFEPKKVRRRERYQRNKGERILGRDIAVHEAEAKRRERPEVYLNQILPRELFAAQIARRQTILPSDYPQVVRELISGRPTHITFVTIGKEVWVPPPDRIDALVAQGGIVTEHNIDPLTDWLEWESEFWAGHRIAYGLQSAV